MSMSSCLSTSTSSFTYGLSFRPKFDRKQFLARVALLLVIRKKIKRKHSRRFHTHPFLKQRQQQGQYATYYKELRNDEEKFKAYLRMNFETFNKLVAIVKKAAPHRLSKRKPLPVDLRLVITMRHLISAETYHALARLFLIGLSTASQTINEMLKCLAETIEKHYVKTPSTPAEWRAVADGFDKKYGLPNCIGVLEGKHIYLKVSKQQSPDYYLPTRKIFSIVVYVLCDSDGNIMWQDVVTPNISEYAKGSDVFAAPKILDMLEQKQIQLDDLSVQDLIAAATGTQTQNGQGRQPYVVMPARFPPHACGIQPCGTAQQSYDLTPSDQQFNHQMLRVCDLPENTIGAASVDFRMLLSVHAARLQNVINVVRASLALENFIRLECGPPPEPTAWLAELQKTNNLPLKSVDRHNIAQMSYNMSTDRRLPL